MLKKVAKAILPKALRQEILVRLGSQHFRDIYFNRQLRAIPSTLRVTGEFSNFTYDLSDRSLR